jgi:tRNA threonylcarbamoyladenosine biosynthesis protein TsaB
MVLLAIDTATRNIGLALHSGTELLAEHMWHTKGFHTVELAPEIALMLRRAQRSVADITAIAVASGPGSFTGLRIGMALGKGLCIAHNLKMVSVPTLDILASAQPEKEQVMFAVIQAGRKRIAGAWYESRAEGWVRTNESMTMTWEEFIEGIDVEIFICGEIGSRGRDLLKEIDLVTISSPAGNVRRPGILAELAWKRIQTGDTDDPVTMAPLYLKSRSVPEG